ncbi:MULTISPECIES: DUF3772 domain-containing protein [unclassified Novosphingobium]|uniref:DUF3772 domain-containing protein n=1 Tax=unclassified Novosphingobium TaxID=2644732 RepID=UPI00135C4ABE|nr:MULTISPECIES: DUF3772 domain-containing protein [unclassified Novosphingobium]
MRALYRLILALLLFTGGAAHAQVASTAEQSSQIKQAEADLRDVDRALDTRVDAEERAALRTKALAAQSAARTAGGQLEEQIALIDARVAGLGPVTEGVAEAPDIQQQRARLAKTRATVDAAAKRGRLADVEAQQLIGELDRGQAEQLNETLSTRVESPLSPTFWSHLLAAAPRDMRRVDLFVSQGVEQIGQHWRGGLPWQALLGVALAFALMFPIRVAGREFGQRYLIGTAPGHRVRRSLYALWRVFVGTAAPLLAAFVLVQGLRWGGLFPKRWDDLLDGFVAASGFAAFIASLAGAVLMRKQPSWRIAPIADETARRVHPLILIMVGIAFACILLDAFNQAVGASPTALAAWQMAEALVHLLWIGSFLLLLGRLRADAAAQEHADDVGVETSSTGAGLAVLTLVTWALVLTALFALACGYVGLSVFIARLIIWIAVLAAALYLLLGTADDAATTVFSRHSPLGIALTRSVGLRGSLVDQFGVLISGALRIFLVLVALGMLMTPFGGGGGIGSFFGRLGAFAQGIEIGGVAISPGAIIRSALVLTVGLALVRAFMSWLEKRYLPATDLDGSARNSAGLVARYVGIALAIIWALASLGIGVERIALLLSALSVGIGFGLQAITQNFVSGLILLAERPIKIGDWVRVGTDEGDVKRISVRSTEITLADHSTLIVPNSELITKTVLNKTLSSPLGRIQIQFSVPLETEVDKVLGIVLGTFSAEPAVLETPGPAAFVDSIADGRILFNCFAHVASPRDVYRARSNVFLVLLRRFGDEGIDIGTVAQRLELLSSDRTAIEDGGRKDTAPQPPAT